MKKNEKLENIQNVLKKYKNKVAAENRIDKRIRRNDWDITVFSVTRRLDMAQEALDEIKLILH